MSEPNKAAADPQAAGDPTVAASQSPRLVDPPPSNKVPRLTATMQRLQEAATKTDD